MCGILGVLSHINMHVFKKTLDTLIHRGPDSSGVWSDENITLGHRRLAIVDLSTAGHQPMMDSSARYVMVYNGEIYNFIEIRNELKNLGEKLVTHTDSEVLLVGYRRWGERVFDKCNGMWSVAIWDKQEKSLFLSRDRFGKKPLFYSYTKYGFVFASEMKAIYPYLENVQPSDHFHWTIENVFQYEATDKTLIKNIHRFPAGHHGKLVQGDLKLKRYWCTLDNLVDVPVKYEDQVDRFKELLFDSIQLRMRADVPLGTALSGGLDSSSILAGMSYISKESEAVHRHNPVQQRAFVASFSGSDIDESIYAREVTDFHNIETVYENIDPTAGAENIVDSLYKFEELYLTNPFPMMSLYGTVRRHGTIVTLDGHGADELLGGYRGSLFEAFPDATWVQRWNLMKTYKDTFPKHTSVFNNRNFNYPVLMSYGLYKALLKKIKKTNPSLDYTKPGFNYLSGMGKHLYILFHETILPTLLRNYDRFGMMNGVEIRMPFMDHRLVQYVFSLPQEVLTKNGYTKNILRDSISSHLPKNIVWRKDKIGFGAPMDEWIKGPLKEFFNDTISSKEFEGCPLIKKESVVKIFDKIWKSKENKFSDGEKAWSLIMPFFWWKSLSKSLKI